MIEPDDAVDQAYDEYEATVAEEVDTAWAEHDEA